MSSNKFNPMLVGKVRVWHKLHSTSNSTFVGLHDEKALIRISTKARDDLATQNALPKVWTLEDMDKKALEDVLSRGLRYGTRLHLNANGRSMMGLIELLHVVKTLGITPPQKQVEGHLVHLLTHSAITPTEMVAVHQRFGYNGEESRPWRVMVQTIAFDVAHGKRSVASLLELNKAATPYPDLDNAVKEKIAHLRACKERKEEVRQHKEQERQAKQQKRSGKKPQPPQPSSQGSNGQKKKTFESFHEKNEKIRFEEENGLRATSENTVAWIKQHKPTGYWITPKLNQVQKKELGRARMDVRFGRLNLDEKNEEGDEDVDEGEHGDENGADDQEDGADE